MTFPAADYPERHLAARSAVGAVVALLVLVTVALAGVLAPGASASPLDRPQNAVGVIARDGSQVVGAHQPVLAGECRARAPNYDQTAVGSCVGAEGEVPQVLANQAAGNAARDAIAAQYPGAETEVSFQTDLGVRRVDVLTSEGEAIESKVGYTSLTQSIQTQIAKDQLLLANNPSITGVSWEFSPSAVTGQVGPSGPLADALAKAEIPWFIGGP